MKILLVHNYYRTSAPSGEDVAVRNERRMLESRGEDVVVFERFNDDIRDSDIRHRIAVSANTIWSQRSRMDLRKCLRSMRPDVVHVHNTFAVLSPSIYGAVKAEGIPVVQTLHNFRLFCPGALFLRDGKPCELCVENSLLQSVRHRCYRQSYLATAVLASMLAVHRGVGTYLKHIDRFITLTNFAKEKVVHAGLPVDRVVVKPNFVSMPQSLGRGRGGYVAYVGRLLDGKGVETLLSAWTHIPNIQLKIVGDGALRERLEQIANANRLNVDFLGMLDKPDVMKIIADAEFLVVPSECYEGFPMVIAEAYSCGTPVIATRSGSLNELVLDGVTGQKFRIKDPLDLARVVGDLLADKITLSKMRNGAREFFDANLTEDQNYRKLKSIYREVIDGAVERALP